MRLHDLGRAGEGQLPRLRLDHVQEGGPGGEKALLHQRGMLQLHPGGEAGRLAEKDGGERGGGPCPGGGGGGQDRREEGSGRQKDHREGGGQEACRQSRGLEKGIRGEEAHGQEDCREKDRRQEDGGGMTGGG